MVTDFLLSIFEKNQNLDAMVWKDQVYSYGTLLERVQEFRGELKQYGLKAGSVVSLEADFSPNAVALLLALLEMDCTIVPLTDSVASKKPEFREIAQVETVIKIGSDDRIEFMRLDVTVTHAILLKLREMRHPGLILFSSGSTGKSKAAVHDFVPLLEKFKMPRNSKRMVTFLLFDHIGGINTLLYVLSNAGCVITVRDRSPEAVCAAIEKYKAEILPTSPTFINLLLLSEAYRKFDLSNLQLVTYGTEPMPESTLQRFHGHFPALRLQQTYGLSELGILRSKSKSSDSLWVKIGGEGFQTRIVDGLLEIKAESAMLGYLNAASPFTEDGWFKTGDSVEVDGEYLRILGRNSEIINVGGEKVYPAEVESVLQQMEGVEDVAVRGVPNPITGQMVVARVKLRTDETLESFRKRMRTVCRDQLPSFKVPQKIELVTEQLHSERFKKSRNV